MFVNFSKAFDSIHKGKIEQILQAYGLPKETVIAIIMLFKNTKAIARSPDGDVRFFNIVAGVGQEDTLAISLFIICLNYVLLTSIDQTKGNDFTQKKAKSRGYPAKKITDADYADDLVLLENTFV